MNTLLEQGAERGLEKYGRTALREALNQALDDLRNQWRRARQSGQEPEPPGDHFWNAVSEYLAVTPALGLRRALNATGVVLHTGLGRAPWPQEAMAAAIAAARYAILEIDPDSGDRSRREAHVAARLCAITGAEAGLAVNNNAAAVLLAISALARGRKVLMSRGEMVEIGGSYRIPDVVQAAGAQLVEVGTTNRTHAADFLEPLQDPQVACVIKVHPSNFRLEGFQQDVSIQELSGPCREHGVPLVYDLGSGVLTGLRLPNPLEEPTVRGELKAGADLVTFSGDKLLGGPQAGLIVGAKPLVERLRKDMLTRCLRLDKIGLAGLEACLSLHALGEEAATERIPALRMLAATPERLRQRAQQFAERWRQEGVPPLVLGVCDSDARVGSGAGAALPIPSVALRVTVEGLAADILSWRLRQQNPAVFGRVHERQFLLDLRTLEAEDEPRLWQVLLKVACELQNSVVT